MKTTILLTGILAAACISCQSSQHEQIAKEVIAVHDEIMPQISTFDKATIEIDSILSNLSSIQTANSSIDTVATRTELTALKSNLEDATDNMMTWMKEYDFASKDTQYQQAELEKISKMKSQFDEAAKGIENKLNTLK